MIAAISKYMPRWLMGIIATALVLATVVGSNQDSAEAIDPADTDTVYIADGTNFADALMGATIASLNTSPMLGVAGTNSGDVIPGDTEEELDRLTNNKTDLLDTIYIFGGNQAVSDSVASQLGDWANDVQRIQGDSRWGTYEAISQMLPSAIDEAVHAQEADHAAEADNADTLDGNDSTDFLGATDKAADSELLDGRDDYFNPDNDGSGSGLDADTVDGIDSANLVQPTGTHEITIHEFRINQGDDAEAQTFADTTRIRATAGGLVLSQSFSPVPHVLFGTQTATLSGAEYCYEADDAGAEITNVEVRVNEANSTDPDGGFKDDVEDSTSRTDEACRTISFSTPVPLDGDEVVMLNLSISFDAAGDFVDMGRVTFIYNLS